MINIEELTNNNSWYVNYFEAKELVKNGLLSYEFCNIELDKIRRFIKKEVKFIKLEETINFKFLANQNLKQVVSEYIKYCKDSDNIMDNQNRSPEHFISLYKKILQEGYDPKKGVIVIDQYNAIACGLHRACILSYINKEKKIPVLKVNLKSSRLNKFPFLIPIYKIFDYFRKKLKRFFYGY